MNKGCNEYTDHSSARLKFLNQQVLICFLNTWNNRPYRYTHAHANVFDVLRTLHLLSETPDIGSYLPKKSSVHGSVQLTKKK